MSRSPAPRALAAAVPAAAVAVAAAPRSLPRADPLASGGAGAGEAVSFGLQLVITGLAAYVALVLLAVALSATRALPGVVTVALGRWTGRGLAGALRRALGLTAVATGLLPLAPAGAQVPLGPPPVLAPADGAGAEPLGPPPLLHQARSSPGRPHRPAPTLVPDGADPRPPPPDVRRSLPPAPAALAVPPQGVARDRHTVRPGESFWSVTEDELTRRLGRTPTPDEVVAWWAGLIAANRSRLVDPTDPDLLRPGQHLRLPRPP